MTFTAPKAILLCAALTCTLASADSTADYQRAIDEQEALYGAYHPALSELHHSLGIALQEQNEHNRAIDVLKQAMHINRVNQGIKSLSQEPMLRSLIDSYDALDQPLPLAGSYQRLIDLYQQNYGASSSELVPLLLEAGNWHRQQYLRQGDENRFAHLDESTKMLSRASTISRSSHGGNSTQLLLPLQSIVKNHYYLVEYYNQYQPKPPRSYLNKHARRFRPRYRSETRLEYERNYTWHWDREEYRLAQQYQRELIQKHTDSGLAAYRTIASIYADNGDARQRASALAAQGDWMLLFKQSPLQANNLYRQSWRLLNDSGDRETRDKLFAKPQRLPAFHSHNPADFSQLAKVQADITPAGHASNIKVLETVPASSGQVADKARQQLRHSLFRSRMVDGEPVASQNVELTLFIE